jgi:glucose/mannose-6-phosphate isomerase
MTEHLDDPGVYEGLDPEDILGRIRDLPRQCREAWERSRTFKVPTPYWKVDKLVILGMGGSAIAGDLLRSLAARRSRKPVFVCRGYELPSLVDENTLVVACSYSGETEETLAAFSQALRGPAKKVVLTTGGRLAALAREYEIPAFFFDYKGEPRSALGYGIMPLLALAEQVGILKDMEAEAAGVALMGELVQQLEPRWRQRRTRQERRAGFRPGYRSYGAEKRPRSPTAGRSSTRTARCGPSTRSCRRPSTTPSWGIHCPGRPSTACTWCSSTTPCCTRASSSATTPRRTR